MKKVVIIGTGGTISALGEDQLDYTNYRTGSLTIDEIVAQIGERKEQLYMETTQLQNFSSCDVTPVEWKQLQQLVEHYLIEKNFDGAVITHGTSTIEETAYFLHLTVRTGKPIVLVGAQRPFNVLGSDAALNLLQAIRVASAEEAVGKGVFVLLNGGIHSAREVTKVDTYRVDGMKSGDFGLLRFVDADGSVQLYREPTRKHTTASTFAGIEVEHVPEVAIVYSYAGATGEIIRSLIDARNVKGIVIAGTGAGKFSTKEKEALVEATKNGIAVVRSSRLGNGRVVPLREYENYSFIAGDNLLPQKARILLMLSLIKTDDVKQIQQLFYEY